MRLLSADVHGNGNINKIIIVNVKIFFAFTIIYPEIKNCFCSYIQSSQCDERNYKICVRFWVFSSCNK